MNTTIPVQHVLKTAKMIGRLAYLIALIGVVGSYGTQAALLLDNEVGWFSWVIPATIDLLAICSALALQLPDLDRGSRKIAGTVLTVSVLVSVTANVAGGHNTIARIAHAWPVVAYLLGELLSNRVRSYAARLAMTVAEGTNPSTTQVSVPDTAAELEHPEQLPEAPVSPAPARPRKRTIAERMAAGEDIQPSVRTDRRYRTGK